MNISGGAPSVFRWRRSGQPGSQQRLQAVLSAVRRGQVGKVIVTAVDSFVPQDLRTRKKKVVGLNFEWQHVFFAQRSCAEYAYILGEQFRRHTL